MLRQVVAEAGAFSICLILELSFIVYNGRIKIQAPEASVRVEHRILLNLFLLLLLAHCAKLLVGLRTFCKEDEVPRFSFPLLSLHRSL